MSKVKVKMILPTISLSWLKLFNNSCRKLELNSSPFKCKRSTIRSFHLFQMVFRKREDGAVGLSHRALLLHDGTQHSMTLYAHIWHGPRLHTTELLSSCKMVILDYYTSVVSCSWLRCAKQRMLPPSRCSRKPEQSPQRRRRKKGNQMVILREACAKEKDARWSGDLQTKKHSDKSGSKYNPEVAAALPLDRSRRLHSEMTSPKVVAALV